MEVKVKEGKGGKGRERNGGAEGKEKGVGRGSKE